MVYVDQNSLNSGSFSTSQASTIVERSRLVALPHPGFSLLQMAHDQRFLSVLWPIAKQYGIFRMPDYVQIEGGEGSSLAWSTTNHHFAVLSAPSPQIPSQKPGKKLKGKAAEKAAAQAKAAAEAARQMALMGTKVVINNVQAGGSSVEKSRELSLPDKYRPVQVY